MFDIFKFKVLFVLFFSLIIGCRGQHTPISVVPGLPHSDYTLGIINSGDSTIGFYLSEDGEDWDYEEIEPKKNALYTNTSFIKIITKGKENMPIIRQIFYGYRYQIFWDKSNKNWDILKISN